jgi:hypothetical protein
MNGRGVMLIAVTAGLIAGCGGAPKVAQSVDDAEPRARMAAIAKPGAATDQRRMWELIEALESDDPAVRMMSIATLERLTGTRRGFEPYDSFETRQAAIDRWYQSMEQRQEEAR